MEMLFEDQSFEALHESGAGWRLANAVLRRCSFSGCSLGMTAAPASRPLLENVQLLQCRAQTSWLGAVVMRQCTLEEFSTDGECTALGAFFDRVTFRGRLGALRLCPTLQSEDPQLNARLLADNGVRYRDVEWAVDIREARPRGMELLGVPADMVRRDPQTQVVVTHAAALRAFGGAWPLPLPQRAVADGDLSARLGKSGGLLAGQLGVMLDHSLPDVVLVASSGAPRRRFQEELDGLAALVDMGIATR